MPNIIQDLKLKSDPSTIVNPNIVSDNIPSGAVTTAKIASNAVTAGKIASGAVTASKIENGAVQQAHISVGAVTEPKIDTGAVTTTKIADGAVTWEKIAAGTIIDNNIMDNAIHASKLVGFHLNPTAILTNYPTLQDLLDWLDTFTSRELATISFFTWKNGYHSNALVSWNSSVPAMRIFYFNDANNAFEIAKLDNDTDYLTFVTSAYFHIACNGVEEQ